MPHLTYNAQYLMRLAIISSLYIATALFGFEYASINNNVTLIWIPSGIGLAAFLIYGVTYWPAIAIGALVANLLAGISLPASAWITFGNTLQAIVACWLIQSLFHIPKGPFRAARDVLLVVFACIVGASIAAANGALALTTLLGTTFYDYWDIFMVWWTGDLIAMLLFSPALLVLMQPLPAFRAKTFAQGMLALAIIVIANGMAFYGTIQFGIDSKATPHHAHLTFVPIAALLVIATFGQPRTVALGIIITSIISVTGTVAGIGPFALEDLRATIPLLFLFLAIGAVGAYAISSFIQHHRQLNQELAVSHERFDLVLAGTDDGVWDWNVVTNEVYYSPSLVRMLGYEPEEFPGYFDEWEKRLHPDDRQEALKTLYAHRDNYQPDYKAEYRLRCKDGSYLWILGRGRAALRDTEGRAIRMVGTHVNLTDRKQQEARNQLAARVLETTPDGVIITDAQQKILEVNAAFTKTTGYSHNEVIGKTPAILSSGRHDKQFYQNIWLEIARQGFWQGEIWNRRKNGEIYPEWMNISAITSENGEVMHYAAVFSDISTQEHLKVELHNFAYYDALTQLPNRDLFFDRLNLALHQAHDNASMLAILFLDLDRFKNINDTLGHTVGDALLVEAAHILNERVSEGDTVARLGGDEFIVLIPSITDPSEVALLAESILDGFSQPLNTGERELFITTSIGISFYPEDGSDVETLIKNADTAMYRAKSAGHNQYIFYHTEMSEHFAERLELEGHLRRAINNDELFLVYQPQMDLASGEIIGMEALIRWQHPERGLIPPEQFIGIAEDSGLIIPIGKWIAQRAVADTYSILDCLHDNFKLAVNLSGLQLKQHDIVSFIDGLLHAEHLPHHHLSLELTESMLMEHVETTINTMKGLNLIGVQIAIDDFGTGYSSLSYLKKFPIAKLKIDQSFVRDICTDKDDAEIVSTIIAMGHNLNIKVIAEGVETEEQMDFLKRQGCDEIQGYYFSRPAPITEIRSLLTASALSN